jgi:iron complex outermembrane receptor protein
VSRLENEYGSPPGVHGHPEDEGVQLLAEQEEADEQDKPGDYEEATDGYTRWDLGGEYRLALNGWRDDSELLLFLKLKNAGDEQIRLSTSFLPDVAPEAGRSLEAGLRYTF